MFTLSSHSRGVFSWIFGSEAHRPSNVQKGEKKAKFREVQQRRRGLRQREAQEWSPCEKNKIMKKRKEEKKKKEEGRRRKREKRKEKKKKGKTVLDILKAKKGAEKRKNTNAKKTKVLGIVKVKIKQKMGKREVVQRRREKREKSMKEKRGSHPLWEPLTALELEPDSHHV